MNMVDAEMQKLMDSIDAFFEKKDVELESKMHITKLLSEQYWDEMVGDEEPEDDDFEVEEEAEPEEPELEEVPEEPEVEVEDEVEDLEEVPDEIPPLKVPKPPVKGHEVAMKEKLQSNAGKLLKPKPKIKR